MPDADLAADAADRPFCRRTVRTLARGLDPQSAVPLRQVAESRDATAFLNLATAAASAGAPIEAEALVLGATLIADAELLAMLAGRATGDVAAAMIGAVDRGGLDGWLQASALLTAAYWCKREGAEPPPELVRRARTVARWAPDDDTLAAVLAIAELVEDEHLTTLLSTLDRDAWKPVVREVADVLARAFVGKPLDRVPEHPVVPSAPTRKAPKVGRNDACPCGSGKKYKRCCEGTDLEQAGVPALPEALETVPPHTLTSVDPEGVPEDRRSEVLGRLIQGSEVEAAARLITAWGGPHAMRVEALATAALTGRPEVARALLDDADEPVPLSGTIKLLEREEAIEALEAQAEADLDTGSVVTAWAALRGPLPRLGLLVARGVIADPQVHVDDAAWLLDEVLFVRDSLGLPPLDRAEGWLVGPDGAQDSLRAELEATRQQLEQTTASKHRSDAALRRAEQERSRFESEAARAARKVQVDAPVADPAEVAELRDEVKRLKASIKPLHDDRNALRREVKALEEALDEARASDDEGAAADAEAAADDAEAGVQLSDAEVRTGLRLPTFPDGFLDTLSSWPGATGATALHRIGELCSGRAVGWRDVKALQGFDNVWRVRIGRSYRLLFRVHEAELEILDLVHRQDLEKKLHQLKALR